MGNGKLLSCECTKEYPRILAFCILRVSIKPDVSFARSLVEYGLVAEVVFPIPRMSKTITLLLESN